MERVEQLAVMEYLHLKQMTATQTEQDLVDTLGKSTMLYVKGWCREF